MNSASKDSRISIHHIGGRAGDRSFPYLNTFEKDFVSVLYDADRDCIEQIKACNENRASELHVMPLCMGDSNTAGTLHLNYDPFTSSLLEFNTDYGAFYHYGVDHDYVFSEAFATMETRDVVITTLDQALGASGASIPPPNFLSIDTQGSEYGILRGAEGVLRSHVVAIVVEVEFHPLYRGQKMFGDILHLLYGYGFHFVRLLDGIKEVAPYRAPIGLRGQGFQMFGDALFLRRVSDLESLVADNSTRCLMLKKLAFISIVYKQFEYALHCLQVARRFTERASTHPENETRYLTFLTALEGEVEKTCKEWPRSFASKHTFADSKARFVTSYRKKNVILNVSISRQEYATYSNVEALLADHGFQELADLMRDNRIMQIWMHDYLTANPGFDKENRIAAVHYKVE